MTTLRSAVAASLVFTDVTRSLSRGDESTGIVAYAKVRKEADRVRAAFTAALDVVVCAEVRPADDACAVAVGGVALYPSFDDAASRRRLQTTGREGSLALALTLSHTADVGPAGTSPPRRSTLHRGWRRRSRPRSPQRVAAAGRRPRRRSRPPTSPKF